MATLPGAGLLFLVQYDSGFEDFTSVDPTVLELKPHLYGEAKIIL